MTILHADHLDRYQASGFCQNLADCSAKTADHAVLLRCYDCAGFFRAFLNQLCVNRFDAVHINHSYADALFLQHLSGSDRGAHHQAACDDGNIAAFSYNHALAHFKLRILRMAVRSRISRKTDVHRLIDFNRGFNHPVGNLRIGSYHNIYPRKRTHHGNVLQSMMGRAVKGIG